MLTTGEFIRITVNGGSTRPDLAYLHKGTSCPCLTFEIKPSNSSVAEIWRGIGQCSDSYVSGYESYFVIPEKCFEKIKVFLGCLPRFGIYTYIYSPEFSVKLSRIYESTPNLTTLKDPKFRIRNKPIIEQKVVKKGRKINHARHRVKTYTMVRFGKTIRVKGHLGKDPKRTKISEEAKNET